QQLLSRAISNHGEWSLHRLQDVVQSRSALEAADIDRMPDAAMARIRTWLSPLRDHTLVDVFDSNARIVYSQPGHDSPDPDFAAGAVPWLQSIVDYRRTQ